MFGEVLWLSEASLAARLSCFVTANKLTKDM